MSFPTDSYTPFGYLANPYHRARSWSEPEAGLLRSSDDVLGFGWVEPTSRRPTLEADVAIAVRWNDRVYQSRADFARLGYDSGHHSARLFSYDWSQDAARGSLAFALADRDRLVAELRLANPGAIPQSCEVFVVGRVRGKDARWRVERGADRHSWRFVDRNSGRVFQLEGGPNLAAVDSAALKNVAPALVADGFVTAGFRLEANLGPGDEAIEGFRLVRGQGTGGSGVEESAAVIAARRAEDDTFYREAMLPTGDWPSEWKRGWIYDLETTRACIYPPGGIFQSEWPSWMISWPRVVVAEGTLDALRFSYAAPKRALGLARTIFADAPAPNAPCVFQGGEPNMVAKDGTICGTSPAWCLPFHNLWLLYLRTFDRAWLEELLPRLEAFLEYWRREGTGAEGWIVYKCTYEAGEDCSPRLDPAAEGDEVISQFVRPVELQATYSQSAAVLSKMAAVLGQAESAARWAIVARDYAIRTQRLWDAEEGRYRDWDRRADAFLASTAQVNYWKTDPVRYSALSLTPIVAGIPTPEQLVRLRPEIERYDVAPWCLWPSWSYVVAEAASAAGWHDFAGRFAVRIVDRVYRANDRRTLNEAPRPMPGIAPEFWPLDLAEFNGSDGYGWGATTTSLWVRQVFGFQDGADPNQPAFTLAPALPEHLLRPGRRFGFSQVPYRGYRLDLAYEMTEHGLEALVRVDRGTVARVQGQSGDEVQVRSEGNNVARFRLRNAEAVEVWLEGGG